MKYWILAARPKTLIAGISPVVVGLVLAKEVFSPWVALITLLTALCIQIGTNFANDLFDFLKGSDTPLRKGPLRVTQAGLISISHMKWATFCIFTCTALLGSYLIFLGGAPITLLLITAIFLGVIYTGGPYPLAHLGLGDLFVFTFFGPIACAFTYYLQTHTFSFAPFLAGIGPGCLSTALLTVNNLRDEEEDRSSSKKTLVVRFGSFFGKMEYSLLLVLAPFPFFLYAQDLLPLLILLGAFPLLISVWKKQDPGLLLSKTGLLLWIYTLLFFLSYG